MHCAPLLVIFLLFVVGSFARTNANVTMYGIGDHPWHNETLIREKRQASVVASFWTDSDLSGNHVNILTNALEIPNLSLVLGNFYNSISSIHVINLDYVVTVYTGIGFTGTSWAFRSTAPVNNLAQYGINDQIKSIKGVLGQTWTGPWTGAVVLFEDSNYGGKSIYVEGGSYGPLTTAAYNGAGNFGNDKLSSAIIFPATSAQFFQNADFTPTSTKVPVTASSLGYVGISNFSPGDWASSIIVAPN
jgi:hypothetical protein